MGLAVLDPFVDLDPRSFEENPSSLRQRQLTTTTSTIKLSLKRGIDESNDQDALSISNSEAFEHASRNSLKRGRASKNESDCDVEAAILSGDTLKSLKVQSLSNQSQQALGVNEAAHQLPSGDSMPGNLVRDLKNYLQDMHGIQKRNAVTDLTALNRGLTAASKDGKTPTITRCIDNQQVKGVSVLTSSVSFLHMRLGSARYLSFVVDSQNQGHVVKHDGSHNRSNGITYYHKWYAGEGFRAEPYVKREGKVRTLVSGGEPPLVNTSYKDTMPTGGTQGPSSIHEPTHGRDTHEVKIIAPHSVLPVSNEAAVVPTRVDSQPLSNRPSRESASENRQDAHKSQSPEILPRSTPLHEPIVREPETYFRFIRSSIIDPSQDFFEADIKKCDTPQGFTMELAKGRMWSDKDVQNGNFFIKTSIEGETGDSFLMNGADIRGYREMMEGIKAAREMRPAEDIVIRVERWSV